MCQLPPPDLSHVLTGGRVLDGDSPFSKSRSVAGQTHQGDCCCYPAFHAQLVFILSGGQYCAQTFGNYYAKLMREITNYAKLIRKSLITDWFVSAVQLEAP
jgi:hypothetical protein